MKNNILKCFFLVLFAITSATAFCQDADAISKNITKAIKIGNAKELALYFSQNIELTVIESDGTYSKSQAEIIIKDFFAKNPPLDFSINHKGSSKDSSEFYIGSYKTASQKTYRIYFLIKSVSNKMLIQQLQIQE